VEPGNRVFRGFVAGTTMTDELHGDWSSDVRW
jgi:hypothetical protein